MEHKDAYILMMDALDGTLDPEERKRLDAHLIQCNECYAEWQSLLLLEELLSTAPMAPAPDGFCESVLARVDNRSWIKALGALFALSAGSIIVLGIVAIPATFILLGLWSMLNNPADFTQWMVWFNQLVGVSGSLLDGIWTALRLFTFDIAGNPLVLVWTLAAAVSVGLWAHLTRQLAPVRVANEQD